MLEMLSTDALTTVQILAAEGEGDASTLGLLLLLAGPAFYALIYFRYRNSHKRHHHEKETEASTHDMRATDNFVQQRKGMSNSKMKGANHTKVHGALRKFF